MSLQATLARSSRVTKPRRKSALQALGIRRSTSSPSTISGNRKSSTSSKQAVKEEEDDELLDDTGAIASLASDLHFRDVPQYMQYIRDKMFSPIPERAAGMNSTRIAEVLNFRNNLPGIVTIAHIDALSASPTKTEREIAELAQAGVVRSVIVPRSETGSAAVGEGLALVSEWQQKVLSSELSPELQGKHSHLLPFCAQLTDPKPSTYP